MSRCKDTANISNHQTFPPLFFGNNIAVDPNM